MTPCLSVHVPVTRRVSRPPRAPTVPGSTTTPRTLVCLHVCLGWCAPAARPNASPPAPPTAPLPSGLSSLANDAGELLAKAGPDSTPLSDPTTTSLSPTPPPTASPCLPLIAGGATSSGRETGVKGTSYHSDRARGHFTDLPYARSATANHRALLSGWTRVHYSCARALARAAACHSLGSSLWIIDHLIELPTQPARIAFLSVYPVMYNDCAGGVVE